MLQFHTINLLFTNILYSFVLRKLVRQFTRLNTNFLSINPKGYCYKPISKKSKKDFRYLCIATKNLRIKHKCFIAGKLYPFVFYLQSR